jgi:bifunctional ADP-heptose synthase (sugar kinase/adenylyltransferase)
VLTGELIDTILSRLPSLTVGVLGDLFLDRYLDIDASLTEPSVETGLDAYQVVRVRSYPGAAGTVINNLVALGVGRVCPVAIIGDDGEGHELRQALDELGSVDTNWVHYWESRRTPTYTKPMFHEPGKPPRELNRLDIKNRRPMPAAAQDSILKSLEDVWGQSDALVVLDQVSESDCGVVTARVRERLAEKGRGEPAKFVLADSREGIGVFRYVSVKPNQRECQRAVNRGGGVEESAAELARTVCRPVFCTAGERGILLAEPDSPKPMWIDGYPVRDPIDPVGAGDSTSAGIVCAMAGGATLAEAAAFGNLVASITVQQLGTTGTASPDQVRQRWREVSCRASRESPPRGPAGRGHAR